MPDYKLRIIVEGEDRASRQLGGVTGSLGRIAEFTAGNLLATGIEKVFAGATNLAGGFARVTGEAADLNAQLSETQALSGATAGDIMTLKDLVYDLGIDPNLKVSASEAAGAINMLVRNGLSLDEVMDGAARSTVLLANSTGAEFGQAADIATNAMAIFGLEAEDMAAAVNGITGVVNNSQFTIQDYNMALAQGGAAADVAGMSFEEFNAGIVAISSNFASGSDAGTSWKTMVQRLVPQTDDASAAMAALGLNFFEADGSMRSVAEVAGELNRVFEGQVEFSREVGGRTADQNAELQRLNKLYNSTTNSIADYSSGIKGANYNDEQRAKKVAELQGKLEAINAERQKLLSIQGDLVTTTRALTEEEKINYLQTIFGTDAMRAAAALAGYTEEEMSALYKTLGETDAELAAAKRMDNLKGDMEVFAGAVETVRLQIGDKFQPAARQFVQSLTTVAEAGAPLLVAAAEGLTATVTPYIDAFASQVQTAVEGAVAAFEQAGGGPEGLAAGLDVLTGPNIQVTVEPLVGDTLEAGELFAFNIDGGDKFYLSIVPNTGTGKVRLGDIFEWVNAGETGRLYVAELFDWNWSEEAGVKKLKLFDVVDWWSVGDGGALKVKDLFDFTWDDKAGISKLKLGDVVEFLNNDGTFKINIDWKSFLNKPSIAGTPLGLLNWNDILPVGPMPEMTVPVKAEVQEEPNWGIWDHIYATKAGIAEGDINWGPWTNDYEAGAHVPAGGVNWGNHTHTYNVKVRVVDWLNNTAAGIGDFFSGGGNDEPVIPSNPTRGRAIGDASWRGGLVNVHRDEMLALPRGTRIYNPSEAAQLAGAGAGITFGDVHLHNGLDIAELEAKLQRLLYRRR